MKLGGKDIVLAGLAVAIVAVILLFGFPNQSSGTSVTTTWTVDFAAHRHRSLLGTSPPGRSPAANGR